MLFDWRGTLVVPPSLDDWIADGFRRAGRPMARPMIAEISERLRTSNSAKLRLDTPGIDTDIALHRRIYLEVLEDLGIDGELAGHMYASECDWRQNRFAHDAERVIRTLHRSGVLIGVVSDIHFDIRPAFQSLGVSDAVHAYSLSFEIGAQKPDQAIFNHALTALGVTASETVMVGDRPGPDGGAVEHGIAALLLPSLTSPNDLRLEAVLRLVL